MTAKIIVILMPQEKKWAGFQEGLKLFTEDFMEEGRSAQPLQEREAE